MWEVPLGPQQSKTVVNTSMAQTPKPELVQYLHAEVFRPTTAGRAKAIKQGFLNT